MRHSLAPVAALLISVSILLMGQGLQGTLLPVRATLEDFSTVTIGLMGAGYFLGFTLGCLKGGQLVSSVGHVRVFLAMVALASAAPLLHILVLQPWAWVVLRLLTGFCLAVIYVVIESWLNERSTNDNRGFVFSAYTIINLTVLAVGQMMTLLYNPSGMQLFAIASVLVSLAFTPILLSASPAPPEVNRPTNSRFRFRLRLRIRWARPPRASPATPTRRKPPRHQDTTSFARWTAVSVPVSVSVPVPDGPARRERARGFGRFRRPLRTRAFVGASVRALACCARRAGPSMLATA